MFARVQRGLARLNTLSIIGLGVGFFVVFTLFVWHLGSLTPGLSPSEAAARTSSSSLHGIIVSPVNAPHKLLQNLAQSLGFHGATSMRLASAFFALVLLGCFYLLLRNWFGRFIGILGTLMLAATPLFIISARSATANIMLLSPLFMVAAFLWLVTTKRKINLAMVVLSIAVVLCLYAPGGIWFTLLLGGLCYKQILSHFKRVNNRTATLSAILMIVLLAPLAWAIGRHWSVARQLLLFPSHWQGFKELAVASLWTAPSLVWRTRVTDQFIVGRLAILSASQIAMIIFGLFAVATQARRELLALAAVGLIGLGLVALNNSVQLFILVLPVALVLVAAGLKYLQVEWHTVFPKNPIPKGLATLLLVTLVGFQVIWGFHYALTAWPHTAATKSTYVIK